MKKDRVNGKIILRISIFWILVLAVIVSLLTAFFKNYVFASYTDSEDSSEDEQINIEPNQNSVDILKLMVENNYENKKLVNEERSIDFTTEKQDDNQVPKGEEVVEVNGENGTKQVTALQQYNENILVGEEVIESVVTKEPTTEIIHVGTSEFLKKLKIHIGDDVYLLEKADLKKKAKNRSDTLTTINRYLNLEILEVSDKWTKVKYKDFEGYLPNDKLTSESQTPKIKEKNRIAKLKDSLNINMDLNQVSGLNLSDFKTVLGYNASDKNNIFADNVEVFYKAEQKYKVNGIFLASIAIHESAWGTSYLAVQKKNLFGYKAYDRDPINSAQDFENYEDCINTVAEALSKNYLSTTGSFYNGTTVQAVNTKYASDKAWFTKVYSYMEYLYEKLE